MCIYIYSIYRFLRKGEWSRNLPDRIRSRSKSCAQCDRCVIHVINSRYIEYIYKESERHRKLINYLHNKNYKVSNKQNMFYSRTCVDNTRSSQLRAWRILPIDRCDHIACQIRHAHTLISNTDEQTNHLDSNATKEQSEYMLIASSIEITNVNL